MNSIAEEKTVQLSVVIPVTERLGDPIEMHADYKQAVEGLNIPHEFVYVIDGDFPDYRARLSDAMGPGESVKIVQLGKHFGESAAIEAGVSNCTGEWVLTLPAYYQVDISQLGRLFENHEDWDMLVARRFPRIDSKINQWLSKAFHVLVNWMTNSSFWDLGNGTRLVRRSVLEDIPLYGDQHRFLTILASRRGYRVREVKLEQSTKEQFRRVPRVGVYPRRLLDLLTVFFLVKFTKKPLRFFGLIGASLFALGALWAVILVVERMFFGIGLADRPALVLASLLMVLGVQVFALGLVGEIVIFTHARDIREYTVEEVVN